MIRVQRKDFDVGAEIARLTAGNRAIGGVCTFVGLVREIVGDRPITAMTLEHYPAMTEKELQRIEVEARERWPLEATLVVHRYGRLEPGDRIVLVAAASAHREAAFEACHFLIDFLKTKAPFWKLEEGAGEGNWVDARAADDRAITRWTRKTARPQRKRRHAAE